MPWPRRLLTGLSAMLIIALIVTLGVMFRSRATAGQQVLAVTAPSSTTTVAPTTTTTTTSTTTTTTTVPLRVATLAFTGDNLAHRGVVRQARTYAAAAASDAETGAEYDFAPMFELVAPYLAGADVAICHLETPLSPDNTRLSGYPTFNVPREMANGLVAAGYDGCTTASNHSLDRRAEGVAATLDVLDDVGLLHAGMARSADEYDAPTIYDANGISVASLSYSYGFNGFKEPADTPWLVNEINVEEIAAEVGAARAAGADFVVVSLHWGTEYRHTPNQYQLDNAKAVGSLPGVDIVIGHHAHVIQPVDLVGDTPVVYGLGNFLSNQSANCCVNGSQDGVIMQVHLHEREGGGFETSLTYVPTRVDRSDFTIIPVNDALVAPDGLGTLGDAELAASKTRTADVIVQLGNAADVAEAGPLDAVGSIGEVESDR